MGFVVLEEIDEDDESQCEAYDVQRGDVIDRRPFRRRYCGHVERDDGGYLGGYHRRKRSGDLVRHLGVLNGG